MSDADKSRAGDRIVVIGVGNPFRGDDGAGVEAARRLRVRLPRSVDVLELDGDPSSLLDAWENARIAYVIDAVHADGPAGEIHRIHLDRDARPAVPSQPPSESSHALGLGEAVELAYVLGRLPGQLTLVGIAGSRFKIGDPFSESVVTAIKTVVDTIVEEVSAICA